MRSHFRKHEITSDGPRPESPTVYVWEFLNHLGVEKKCLGYAPRVNLGSSWIKLPNISQMVRFLSCSFTIFGRIRKKSKAQQKKQVDKNPPSPTFHQKKAFTKKTTKIHKKKLPPFSRRQRNPQANPPPSRRTSWLVPPEYLDDLHPRLVENLHPKPCRSWGQENWVFWVFGFLGAKKKPGVFGRVGRIQPKQITKLV